MNKLSYIVLGLSFLTLFSCQKEVITPSVTSDNDTDPKWKSTVIIEKNNSDSDNTSNSGQYTNIGSEIVGGGSITDPNNDPDVTKKKKSKR